MNSTKLDYNLRRRLRYAGKPRDHHFKVSRIMSRMWYGFGFNLEMEP